MKQLFSSPYYLQLVGGDYQAIVQAGVDQAGSAPELEDIPWIMGALCFLGRTGEAQGLFAVYGSRMTALLRGASRFFLGVALCREGQFETSKTILIDAFKESRSTDDSHQNFFACQGLAFFRYSTGRLGRARFWADAALKEASGVCFTYGAVLAFELLGHIQLSAGQFHTGFRHLHIARDKAAVLGQGALLQVISISIVLYRATYGIAKNSSELITLLESFIADEHFEDSYTQAALNLELARVLILRGDLLRAKEQLEASSTLVYKIDNPDLEMDYNLQLAHLLRCKGELHQALSIVRAAKHRVESGQDIRSRLKVLGFESQLLKAMGRMPEHEATSSELSRLSKLCGSLMAKRYLHRHRFELLPDIRQGEDALGDLIDRVACFKEGVVEDILSAGWFGLLPASLNILPSEKVLYFDAEPGSLTIFSQGHVQHQKEGCSTLIRRLLILLSKSPSSKETIANQLWRQSYNPMRHDGLIYALVAKARKILGLAGDWIEAYELGYRLRHGVKVSSSLLSRDEKQEPVAPIESFDADPGKIGPPLNPRQMLILDLMQQTECIEPGELVRRLGVSDATISRDMAHLIEVGCARRLGRGRATRYCLETSKALGV